MSHRHFQHKQCTFFRSLKKDSESGGSKLDTVAKYSLYVWNMVHRSVILSSSLRANGKYARTMESMFTLRLLQIPVPCDRHLVYVHPWRHFTTNKTFPVQFSLLTTGRGNSILQQLASNLTLINFQSLGENAGCGTFMTPPVDYMYPTKWPHRLNRKFLCERVYITCVHASVHTRASLGLNETSH